MPEAAIRRHAIDDAIAANEQVLGDVLGELARFRGPKMIGSPSATAHPSGNATGV